MAFSDIQEELDATIHDAVDMLNGAKQTLARRYDDVGNDPSATELLETLEDAHAQCSRAIDFMMRAKTICESEID